MSTTDETDGAALAPRHAPGHDEPITRLPGADITHLDGERVELSRAGRTDAVGTDEVLRWMRGHDRARGEDGEIVANRRTIENISVADLLCYWLAVMSGFAGVTAAIFALDMAIDSDPHNTHVDAVVGSWTGGALLVLIALTGVARHAVLRARRRISERNDRIQSLRHAWEHPVELSPTVSLLATARLGAWREGLADDAGAVWHEIETARSVEADAQRVLDDPDATGHEREVARDSLRALSVAAERADAQVRAHRERETQVAAERRRVLEGFARSDRATERRESLARMEQGTQLLLGAVTDHDEEGR